MNNKNDTTMQQQFTELAKLITNNAKDRYRYAAVPDQRLRILTDMTRELVALKISWEAMTGQKVELPSFTETMRLAS